MRSEPSKRWTALAGACFFWNVLGRRTGAPPVTELARKHPVVTATLWVCLGYHLKPRRSSPPSHALPPGAENRSLSPGG